MGGAGVGGLKVLDFENRQDIMLWRKRRKK